MRDCGVTAALEHHAGADRVVRRLVDQDERAGAAVARVGVDDERLGEPEPDDAEVVQLEPLRAPAGPRACRCRRRETSSSTTRRNGARRVLDERAGRASSSGRSLIQQTRAVSSRATTGGALGIGEHVAARDVDVVLEPDRHRLAAGSPPRARRRALSTAATRLRQPGRQHDDLVAGAPDAARDLTGVAAVVVVLVGHRPDHPLHREAPVLRGCGRRRARSSRGARAASGPRTTASRRVRSTTLSPLQRRDRDHRGVPESELRRRARRARARSRRSAPPRSRRGPSC